MLNEAIFVNSQELITIVEPNELPMGFVYAYKLTLPQPNLTFLNVYEQDSTGKLYGLKQR